MSRTTISLPFSPEDVREGRVTRKSHKEMATEMRRAIDAMEIAMMGLGDFADLPHKWGEPRHRPELGVSIKATAGQVYRVCDALSELTRIINSPDYVI